MKKRLLLLPALALALFLTACGGPAGESVPPEGSAPQVETDTPAPSVSSGQSAPSASVAASSEPPAAEGFDPVYTDWSRLEPYQPDLGLYTRYYEGFTDRLIAVEGGYGGPLVPFPGASIGNGMDGGGKYLFGLATADGTVVCDPVYESISYSSSYNQELERYVENNDFLILCRTFFEGEYDPVNYWMGEYVYTVAAGDGSWVLEEEYRNYFALYDGRLMLMDADEAFWFCDRDGTLERSPLRAKPSEMWGDWWQQMGSFENGVACMEVYDPDTKESTGYRLANALTGEVVDLPDIIICDSWDYSFGEWAGAQDRETHLWGYLDKHGNWSIQPQFRECDSFEGEYACVTLTNERKAVIDQTGQVVLQAEGDEILRFPGDNTPYYLILEKEDRQYFIREIYDQSFTPLPDHPILGSMLFRTWYSDTAAATRDGDVWTFWDASGVMYTVETDAEFYGTENGLLMFRGGDSSTGLYDPKAEAWVIPQKKDCYYITRCYELEEAVYEAWGWEDEYELLDADGELIARVDRVFGGGNGLIRVQDGEFSGFLDTEGNWVFRWPILDNND